jgi:basic amino acid/polyamine antiporter, APA family
MTHLARKLRLTDYFTLGWGTMVGVGWLVVMDDWLLRGGPLGAMLGFALGAALLLPIGYVYGRLVQRIPDASGEVAYTATVFPRSVSFATGWMMMLSYFIVCPWEAVAVGRLAAYIFPALNSAELYRVGGKAIYLPHLALGLMLTALLTILNYRGIRLSATFQNWAAFGVIALFVIFAGAGFTRGSVQNLQPLFSHGSWLSILLVMQIVPYYMTGFEAVGKCAEEASPDFRGNNFFKAIAMAILVGGIFYVLIVGVVAYAAPWKPLTSQNFMTAVALERAIGARWVVQVIMIAALLSLVKCFNGNFVAASRLLFALGRRGLVPLRLSQIHATNLTPSTAVLWVGLATAAAMLLGQAILVPISEVGSVASALGWTAACAAYFCMRPGLVQRAVAAVGALVGILMVLMKVVPLVPGHFDVYEWIALGLWCVLGTVLHFSGGEIKTTGQEEL